MKTKKTIIFAGLTALTFAVVLFSCNSPLALGSKLDVQGPLVAFTSPAPRKAVKEMFTLEGTVSDKSSIRELHIKASLRRVDYAKQWRWTKSDGWQVSEDFGSTWTAYEDAEWNGDDKDAQWVLSVDLRINGVKPQDGEYMFTAQAWDTAGMSDDNSLRTLVLIYDIEPPLVDVFDPSLFSRFSFDGSDFQGELQDTITASNTAGVEWRKPELLGKFLTHEFQLKWQIEDNHDIKSIELLFYDYGVEIDNNPNTPPPQNYIYYYFETEPENVKPNGSVWVPNLTGAVGTYSGDKYKDGELKSSLGNGRSVIKVVSVCYDKAGHSNEEKTLGFFIFWPDAAEPWITYTDGMLAPSSHVNDTPGETGTFFAKAFMIYPGRNIRATAFQTQGVSKVQFEVFYYVLGTPNTIGGNASLSYMAQHLTASGNAAFVPGSNNTKVEIYNPPRPNGSYSQIFAWDFVPEARSNNYVVRAVAFDPDGKEGSAKYDAVFRVQDITFPDFPTPPRPAAGEPLFKFIGRANGDPNNTGAPAANNIRISGIVADATDIDSLYMVWINPNSTGYAAMNQLSYFRDPDYRGWTLADPPLPNPPNPGPWPINEGYFDGDNPNKIWKVNVTKPGAEDNETGRMWFRYSLDISLPTHLSIGPNPLASQVFLLRAKNSSGKSTIITYAPQGDTVVPTMEITNVQIGGNTFNPGAGFVPIPKFLGTETIVLNGTWREDSTGFLNSQTYFYNNMRFSINGVRIVRNTAGTGWVDGLGNTLNGITVTVNPTDANAAATQGTFVVSAQVRESTGTLRTSELKDTLVVNASSRDIGNNYHEDGASWLIESENLQFLRVSSDDDDHAYRAPEKIRIFLEFNKPVVLKQGGNGTPVLLLNTGGSAAYETGQGAASSKHYFIYTIGAAHNTDDLNVTGIAATVGGTTTEILTTNQGTAANYPFTFLFTDNSDETNVRYEEIRLTRFASHTGAELTGQSTATTKVFGKSVPVNAASGAAERPFTLGGGKDISIDNTAPVLQSISTTSSDWLNAGKEIYITAAFNENVRLGTGMPYLTLSNTFSGTNNNRTSTSADDVRVSNNRITFKFTVKPDDSTGANQLYVTGFGGDILDVPGNSLTTVTNLSQANRTLPVYLDTATPAIPTVTVWQGTAPANNGAPTGTALGTSGGSAVALGNMYHDAVFVRIAGTAVGTGTAVNQNYGRLEYTLNGTNWTSLTSANLSAAGGYNIQLSANGSYTIRARQIDQAGNINATNSGETYNITFNLDMGTLITSINSITPNGDYTYNAGTSRINDKIEIQVNFRKPLTFPANTNQTLTLNVTGGAAGTATYNPGSNPVTTNQATFTYTVTNGQNTGNNNLNVTALSLNVTDNGGAVPAVPALALPAAANNLGVLKAIRVVTGGLTVESGPTFNINRSGDEATGTISLTFNRNITKGSGNIIIRQNTDGYRLPAVLTEAQSTRYRSITGFDTNYTRGTNGFINGSGSDTTTKYVLNYTIDTPVTPGGSGIALMAANFLAAETVTLPVTSQDVSVSGRILTITITDSNALQVLGAGHTITIPVNGVQDNLEYKWPATDTPYTFTTPGVNKPFIRVDKKINKDSMALNGTGTTKNPLLQAGYQLTTQARIDCRTPGSVVQYIAEGTRYDTAGAQGTAASVTTPGSFGASQTGDRDNWMNNNDISNRGTDVGTQRDPQNPPNGFPAVTYNSFTSGTGTHLTVGDDQEQGYVWRISAKGRTGAAAGSYVYSDMSEEIAFRTVLTVQVYSMNYNLGTRIGSGDNLWIRGGDALSSSSVPGFPLTWEDDSYVLQAEKKRAGIRLLKFISVNPSPDPTVTGTEPTTGVSTDSTQDYAWNRQGLNNNSLWRWISWEINVKTYYDVFLGREAGAAPTVERNWQYGPRLRAPQRGGWSIQKDYYPMFPGKHRYIRIYASPFNPGGQMNFSSTFVGRPDDMPVTINYTP